MANARAMKLLTTVFESNENQYGVLLYGTEDKDAA